MSDRLIVIGISGVAESGKDTAAGILSHRHGFFRIALADGVRSALRDLDGATWSFSKELEKAGRGVRWALQRLGGDAREKVALAAERAREEEEDHAAANLFTNRFWVNLAATKIAYAHEIHPSPRHRFVIPDVSYHYEVYALREIIAAMGGRYETWRIARPGAGLSGESAMHASEIGRATIPVDHTIANTGTIADLERAVTVHADRLIRQKADHVTPSAHHSCLVGNPG